MNVDTIGMMLIQMRMMQMLQIQNTKNYQSKINQLITKKIKMLSMQMIKKILDYKRMIRKRMEMK